MPGDLYDPSDVAFLYIDTDQNLWLNSSGAAMAAPPSSRTWGRVTWDATIDYKVARDILLFGRVANGFRSGNYNIYLAVPEDITTYEPETLMSYEAGIKSSFFDRRLKINITGFHYDISDMQVSALTDVVTGTKVVNAASARVDGVELEAVVEPVDGLSLSLGYGYQNARYHKFPNSSVPSAINGGDALDVSGASLGSPKHTLNLGGNYQVALGTATLRFNTDWRYTSKQPGAPWLTRDFDELNHSPWLTEAAYEVIRDTFNEKASWLGNATVGYKFGERGPELSLWVKNITNNAQEGGFGMFFNRSLSSIPRGDRKRSYGLGLSYSF